jgi:hypothetical protein
VIVENTELEPAPPLVRGVVVPAVPPPPTVTVYAVLVVRLKADSADAPPPEVPTEVL